MKRVADVSEERRNHALNVIRGVGLASRTDVSDDAKLMFVVGTLVCDDTGRLATADLEVALDDPSVIQVASELLRQAVIR